MSINESHRITNAFKLEMIKKAVKPFEKRTKLKLQFQTLLNPLKRKNNRKFLELSS